VVAEFPKSGDFGYNSGKLLVYFLTPYRVEVVPDYGLETAEVRDFFYPGVMLSSLKLMYMGTDATLYEFVK